MSNLTKLNLVSWPKGAPFRIVSDEEYLLILQHSIKYPFMWQGLELAEAEVKPKFQRLPEPHETADRTPRMPQDASEVKNGIKVPPDASDAANRPGTPILP